VSIITTIAVAAVSIFLLISRKDTAGASVVYEPPLAAGADPFTSPVDVSAASVGATIPTPSVTPTTPESPGGTPGSTPATPGGTGPSIRPGNFGGTGFTTVCDRELLIRQLQSNPAALAAWAGVHRIAPEQVPQYIRSLRPSVLTQGTRVTNHSFKNGKAVPFQSIQAAGTAVLVDDAGRTVARCRCGNPLLEPIPVGSGTCKGCPQGYKPPALLPRGQVPPVVVVQNPPPVIGGVPTTQPTATPSTFATSTIPVAGGTGPPGGVGGRWTFTSSQNVSGSNCQTDQSAVIQVTQNGSQLTIVDEAHPQFTYKGAVNSDGTFDVIYQTSSFSTRLTGRFAGNLLQDGRGVTSAGGQVLCEVAFTAERKPFG
jgi:hypothetical protein